jgi:predicted PurR-regulated permease PerM
VVTPPLLGQASRMNALAVFMGLLVSSWVWNIWETILAVPILAVIKSFADHIPHLRKFSQLLSA